MKNYEDKEIDIAELRKKYETDPLFHTLMDFLSIQPKDEKELTVDDLHDRMCKAGLGVSRPDVVRMLQSLHGWECGWFTIGRRGYQSRFWFYASSVRLGKEISGIGKPAEKITPPPKMLTHRFRLRPELEITIELPSDLSPKEVVRIGDFLKTLPFESANLGRAA